MKTLEVKWPETLATWGMIAWPFGCSSGINDYLERLEPSIGGSAKLTLSEVGISRVYFTDNGGGISVREGAYGRPDHTSR